VSSVSSRNKRRACLMVGFVHVAISVWENSWMLLLWVGTMAISLKCMLKVLDKGRNHLAVDKRMILRSIKSDAMCLARDLRALERRRRGEVA